MYSHPNCYFHCLSYHLTVDTMTFPSEDDLLGLHLYVKNSTLLEDSHAENINTHHPPNLSTIIGDTVVFVKT